MAIQIALKMVSSFYVYLCIKLGIIMKLVVDENIPQGKEAFGKFGDIVLAHGRKISNDMLKDADILIVRSITKVDESLLNNTKVKFVGTATIGTDHVNKSYLEKENIYFADAAGCNAFSVAEYVVCAINQYLEKYNKKFSGLSIGVIGYGNVGSKVVKYAKALGMKVLINDPPLERNSRENIFCSLDEALTADIITFHVPLNKSGIDKTVHLLNETNINKIKSGSMLINSSRGPVVDNNVLLKRLKVKSDLFTILDVWEGEPDFIPELLEIVDIGTPHIAGYSFEGKINGTKLINDKLSDFLKTKTDWQPIYPSIEKKDLSINANMVFEYEFNALTKRIYDIRRDSRDLKKALSTEVENRGKFFDELRKKYYIRREFCNYNIITSPQDNTANEILRQLRFNILDNYM